MSRPSADSPVNLVPPRLTIFLVSAMALAYEILLMRLFSIVQYHHFAYMVISMALLGYGASGTFLSFFREKLLRSYPVSMISGILLFGITALGCFLGGQHLLFNPDELLWDNRQWFRLVVLYLLLSLPFFFAAGSIALTFSQYRKSISEVYAADLVGAGVGGVLVIVMLFVFFPQKVLLLISSMIILAAGIAWLELSLQPRNRAVLFIIPTLMPLLLPLDWQKPAMSPYKSLSQQMRIAGSTVVEEHSSPLGLLTLVENSRVPFRHVPGMSLAAEDEPPEQIGIFIDGSGPDVITRYSGDMSSLGHLDMITSALPYHLGHHGKVLILGAGGGSAVLQALYHDADHVTGVELNPQIVAMVRAKRFFSGGIYDLENVNIHVGEARSFVGSSKAGFDLVQLPFAGAGIGQGAGVYALNENYLYTTEALQDYFGILSGNGCLGITRWAALPPRSSLKLFATAVRALENLGVQNPGRHLLMIRSWQTFTLLMKKSPFSTSEIISVKEFCRVRFFDLVFYPGMKAYEANRYNLLRQPYYHEGAAALLGDSADGFSRKYKFDITPSSDDRPYFSNFFKWRTLPEIWKLKEQGGMAFLESGYLILVLTLIQAMLASGFIILLPVFFRRTGDRARTASWSRAGIGVYFFSIGLGFLFLEIAFMQKYILFLEHPLFAAASVLAIFLVFAGAGSRFAGQKHQHVTRPVLFILVLGVLELMISGAVFSAMGGFPVVVKALTAVLLLGPLAFCMGMPFPLALVRIGSEAEEHIPWAWAVNGCASVIGAVLATTLAVHFGFSAVIVLSLLFYGIAAVCFPAAGKEPDTS